MSRLLFRRNPMVSPSWEKLQDSRRPVEEFLSWDPAVSSLTASLITTTLVDGILYSRMLLHAAPLTTLPLPSERWSVVDLDSWLSSKTLGRYWYWETPQLRSCSTRVRGSLLSELVHQSRVPRWRGQKLSLRFTQHSASATEMPSRRWSTTWANLCDKCNHGIPLSTL